MCRINGRDAAAGTASRKKLEVSGPGLQGGPKAERLIQNRLPGYGTGFEHTSGQDLPSVLPAKETQERVIVIQHRFPVVSAVAFGRHDERALFVRIGIAGEAFGHGKKAVKSRFQLAGKPQ